MYVYIWGGIVLVRGVVVRGCCCPGGSCPGGELSGGEMSVPRSNTVSHQRRLVINIGVEIWVTNIGGQKFRENIFQITF